MEGGNGNSNGVGGADVAVNGRAAGNSGKAVTALQKSLGDVQGLLDRNRMLIEQINQNQEAREADGLTRNVALIRELNANVVRVVDLYGGLSDVLARNLARGQNGTADPAKLPAYILAGAYTGPGSSGGNKRTSPSGSANRAPSPSGAYMGPSTSGAYRRPSASGDYRRPSASGDYRGPSPSGAYRGPSPSFQGRPHSE